MAVDAVGALCSAVLCWPLTLVADGGCLWRSMVVGDNVEVPVDRLESEEQYDLLHHLTGNQNDNVFFDDFEGI